MMMPTCRPEPGSDDGAAADVAVVRVMVMSRISRSSLARGTDERLHMIEVALEGTSSHRRDRVLGFGNAPFERLRAGDVVGLFELAGVHAQIAVSRLQ